MHWGRFLGTVRLALLLRGAVPGGGNAGADEYTLPLSDPCYSTLEAYKQYARSGIDAYYQAYSYQELGPQLEQWRQCCPEITAQVESLRPDNPDAEALRYFTFSLGDPDKRSACTKHLATSIEDSEPPSVGKAWAKQEMEHRSRYWQEIYSELKAELRACCLRHFDNCLKQAPGKAKSSGTSEKAEVGFCLSRFSPEDQPVVSLPVASPPTPPVAAADQPSPGDKSDIPAGQPRPRSGGDEGPERDFCDVRVAAAEESGRDLCVTMLAKARQDCQNRLEQASAAEVTASRMAKQCELQSRLRELMGGNYQDCSLVTAEMAGLEDDLMAAQAASAPRPGAAELAAFPQGTASPDLARMGGGALLGGFLLGLPARSGWPGAPVLRPAGGAAGLAGFPGRGLADAGHAARLPPPRPQRGAPAAGVARPAPRLPRPGLAAAGRPALSPRPFRGGITRAGRRRLRSGTF